MAEADDLISQLDLPDVDNHRVILEYSEEFGAWKLISNCRTQEEVVEALITAIGQFAIGTMEYDNDEDEDE